jgi:hypothetical protein
MSAHPSCDIEEVRQRRVRYLSRAAIYRLPNSRIKCGPSAFAVVTIATGPLISGWIIADSVL